MSIFKTPLPEKNESFPYTRNEVLAARKRVVFKRHLAKNNIPFRHEMATDELQALYFMSKGHSVQRFNEERKSYRKWGWTAFYPYLNPQTVKGCFGH